MHKSDKTDVPSFALNSSSSSFSSRSQNIFEGLSELEKKHQAHEHARAASPSPERSSVMKDDPMDEENESVGFALPDRSEKGKSLSHEAGYSGLGRTRGTDMRSSDCRSRDKESRHSSDHHEDRHRNQSFKQPRRPPRKTYKSSVPDFKKHPERWTSYSLEDVGEGAMSDRSNAKAALVFLEERRREREKQERKALGLPDQELRFDTSYGACSKGRLSFTRRNQKVDDGLRQEQDANITASSQENCVKDSSKDEFIHDSEDLCAEKVKGHTSTSSESMDTEDRNTSSGFKSRKKVKRHIRSKDSDGD